MRKILLTHGEYAIVDNEDYDRLMESGFKWRLESRSEGQRYAARHRGTLHPLGDATIRTHREVMRAREGDHVDHLNGDGLDNRKKNLRVCTHSDNMRNRKVLGKNNTSGFKGVSWNRGMKKWSAQIQFERKNVRLGFFVDSKEAARAYNRAAKQYHGEFAKLNKIKV